MLWAVEIISDTRVLTRSVLACAPFLALCWNCAVADAPDWAAVAISVMCYSFGLVEPNDSAVLAIVGEFVLIDVQSEPRTFADQCCTAVNL